MFIPTRVFTLWFLFMLLSSLFWGCAKKIPYVSADDVLEELKNSDIEEFKTKYREKKIVLLAEVPFSRVGGQAPKQVSVGKPQINFCREEVNGKDYWVCVRFELSELKTLNGLHGGEFLFVEGRMDFVADKAKSRTVIFKDGKIIKH